MKNIFFSVNKEEKLGIVLIQLDQLLVFLSSFAAFLCQFSLLCFNKCVRKRLKNVAHFLFAT